MVARLTRAQYTKRMKWYMVISIFFCIILTGCSKKIHESIETRAEVSEQIHSDKTAEDNYFFEEVVWVDSSLVGFARVSLPSPAPPASVFHRVDSVPRRGASSKGLRPALVRRIKSHGISVSSDTIGAFYREKEVKVTDKKEVKQDYLPAIFRWLAFVGIICLFVYFICITSRK